MYAIIKSGGKQYRVEKGMTLTVDLLALEAGSSFETADVVFLKTGENVYSTGTPLVTGAKVTATVVGHIKEKKVVVFKKKRRKGYRRTQGHRQNYTQIKITDIQG